MGVVSLGLVLCAGLLPRSPSAANHVRWRPPSSGLAFEAGGQLLSEREILSSTGELTLEFWLADEWIPGRGNQEIVSLLTSTEGRHRILVGQFPEGLILHGGADNPDGDARLDGYVRIDPEIPPRHVAVVSDASGSWLFVDGKPTGLGLAATVPLQGTPFGGRLLLGTSDSGWSAWSGTLLAIAIHDRALAESELAARARSGAPASGTREEGPPPKIEPISSQLEKTKAPLALYQLNERRGARVSAANADAPSLTLADRLEHPLGGGVLAARWPGPRDRNWFWFDVLANVGGFIPLGFAIAWSSGMRGMLRALLLGLLLSVAIESAQPWIAGRQSSLIDVAMNGLGAFLGAALAAVVVRAQVAEDPSRDA